MQRESGIGLTVEGVGGLPPAPPRAERSTLVKMVWSALAISTMLACFAFLKAIAPKRIMVFLHSEGGKWFFSILRELYPVV